MHPQLIIVQQHQAELRAEASEERLVSGARTMQGGLLRGVAVTRLAVVVRRLAGRASLRDTVTTA
jgi:hypothetical protein